MSYKRMLASSAAAFLALAIAAPAYAQDIIPLDNDALDAVWSAAEASAIEADDRNLAAIGMTTTNFIPLNDRELASFPGVAGLRGGILAISGPDPINKVPARMNDADTVTFRDDGPQGYSFSSPGTQINLDASSGAGMVSSSASISQTSPTSSQTLTTGASIFGN